MKPYRPAFAIALALFAGVALAQTKPPRTAYPEARKLYDQFDKTLNQSMLWEKKPLQERAAALKAAMAHRDKVTQMWGTFSSCSSAASAHVNFVLQLNRIAYQGQGGSPLKAFTLLEALNDAESFGNHRAACFYAVEALDIPVKK